MRLIQHLRSEETKCSFDRWCPFRNCSQEIPLLQSDKSDLMVVLRRKKNREEIEIETMLQAKLKALTNLWDWHEMGNSDYNDKWYQQIKECYINSILCYIWCFGKFRVLDMVWKTGYFLTLATWQVFHLCKIMRDKMSLLSSLEHGKKPSFYTQSVYSLVLWLRENYNWVS